MFEISSSVRSRTCRALKEETKVLLHTERLSRLRHILFTGVSDYVYGTCTGRLRCRLDVFKRQFSVRTQWEGWRDTLIRYIYCSITMRYVETFMHLHEQLKDRICGSRKTLRLFRRVRQRSANVPLLRQSHDPGPGNAVSAFCLDRVGYLRVPLSYLALHHLYSGGLPIVPVE